MEICLNEPEEGFILNRLEREGRGGAIRPVAPGVYEYTRVCVDAAELLPWIKSFTGRIRRFSCTNPAVEKRFREDMELMKACYLQPISSAIPRLQAFSLIRGDMP